MDAVTPDSDTTTHILLNGLLWYVILAGLPLIRWAVRKLLDSSERKSDRTVDIHVHRALYPNVTVIRSTPRNPR